MFRHALLPGLAMTACLLATAAPASASPAVVMPPEDSYAATLRAVAVPVPGVHVRPVPVPGVHVRPALPVPVVGGRAKLREVHTPEGLQWRGWTRVHGLPAGQRFSYQVVVTTEDGSVTAIPVCRFVTGSDLAGTCAGYLPVPSGVVRREARLVSASGSETMAGVLMRTYRAKMYAPTRGGEVSLSGTARIREQGTRTWAGSAHVSGLVPGREYRYLLRTHTADGSFGALTVCSFMSDAHGAGACYGRVAAAMPGTTPERADVVASGSSATAATGWLRSA